ncbi:MAG: hypothetical protein WC802_03880 [Patescibacteria group bacterium]|jgi:hypothetical protein
MAQNLLILGAGGGLGKALMTCLEDSMVYGKVIALDRSLASLLQRWPRPKRGWRFIEFTLNEEHQAELLKLIHDERIDVVMDLTDVHTPYVADCIMKDGYASYVNTAFCVDDSSPPLERLKGWIEELPVRLKKPHILFSGMNPGVVNILTAYGIREHGLPKEIVEFEFDSSAWIHHPDRHVITWSLAQFITEMIEDPAEAMQAHGKIKQELTNSLYHCEQLRELLLPIITPRTLPYGCVTAHEECYTLSQRFGIPMKFIYSVHPRTMAYLRTAVERGDQDFALIIGDNIHKKLSGSDHIGIALNHPHKRVTLFNRMANKDVKGASATVYQVMVGVLAALTTLREDKLKSKIYYAEDLIDTSYFSCVMQHLDVQEFERPLFKGSSPTKPVRVRPLTSAPYELSPATLLTKDAQRRIFAAL